MAIYTPRGLKVRISVPVAFALMTRLAPSVSPFKVLKTTEGLESIPGMLAFIAGMVSFGSGNSPLVICVAVVCAQIAGRLINLFGFQVSPGLLWLATSFSYLAGFGLFLGIAVTVGFFTVGWKGVLAFLLGKMIAGLIGICLEIWQMARLARLCGDALTNAEVHFLNAYRWHAARIGITTSIVLEDAELQEEHWMPTVTAFAMEWPEVVRRFTVDSTDV